MSDHRISSRRGRLYALALGLPLLLSACTTTNDPGPTPQGFGHTVRAALQAQTVPPTPPARPAQVTHVELESAWGRHLQGPGTSERSSASPVNPKAQ